MHFIEHCLCLERTALCDRPQDKYWRRLLTNLRNFVSRHLKFWILRSSLSSELSPPVVSVDASRGSDLIVIWGTGPDLVIRMCKFAVEGKAQSMWTNPYNCTQLLIWNPGYPMNVCMDGSKALASAWLSSHHILSSTSLCPTNCQCHRLLLAVIKYYLQ